MHESLRSPRMVAGAVVAGLLFGFPFMALFDVEVLVLGVSLLWAYLFVAWGVVIGALAWVTRDTD